MATPEALGVPGADSATTADPGAAAATGPSVATRHWPQLIPIAQLVAIVLGVLAIIWNQQQTTDSLRNELRAEINQVEVALRAEIGTLRAEVSENGQRLARIEGFLEIGAADASPE